MKKLVGNSLDMLNIAKKLYKYFQIVSFYLNFVYFVFTSTAKVKIRFMKKCAFLNKLFYYEKR